MRDDSDLLLGLKRGDKESLRLIYDKHKNKLLTVAVYLLQDDSDGEDVLHDVFVSLAENIGSLHLRGNLRNYLIASVINRVRDKFRKEKHQTLEFEILDRVNPNLNDPESSAILSEESQLLKDALRRLPLEQRESIILHLNSGLKFKEIARMLDISVGTVQARYRYGLDKLRVILDGEKEK